MFGHPWPLFDLRIRTPHLELRLPTDDDLQELVRAARSGIVDETVFLVPWHQAPSPAMERQLLLYQWRARGTWSPGNWHLPLAAVLDGRPIGMQSVLASDYAIRRVVTSGSWLAREFHGRGYGTEMRGGMLALAFEGLGAEVAESGYFEGNESSARVSEKLGYASNGEEIIAVEGKRILEYKVRCTPETWIRDLVPVTIEGLEPCLKLFGVGDLRPDEWTTF